METYAGAPYFHILDHKPSPPLDLEKVAQIRSQTIDALKNEQPFVYIKSTAIGDSFILDWSIKQILSKLCLEECIPLSNIRISNLSRNEGSQRSPGYKRIDDNLPPRQSFHSYFSSLYRIGLTLGLDIDLDESFLIPQPISNTSQISIAGDKIRQEVLQNYHELVVISQAGSILEKRFSEEAVGQIVEQVRFSFPDSYIVTLSDYKINEIARRSNDYPKTHGEDKLVYCENIDDITSFFYSSDTVITTDTFWGHLAAGCKVLRPDRNGRLQNGDWLGMYTMAWPEVWGIPGGHVVESPAAKAHIEEINSKRDKYHSIDWALMWSTLDDSQYYQYLEGIRGALTVRKSHSLIMRRYSGGIDQSDIDLLLQSILEIAAFRK